LFASKEEESAEKGWCYIYKMGLAKSGDTCVRLKSVSAVAVFPPLSFSKNFQSHFPGFPPLCNDILKQFARLIRRHVKFFNCQQIGNNNNNNNNNNYSGTCRTNNNTGKRPERRGNHLESNKRKLRSDEYPAVKCTEIVSQMGWGVIKCS